jgi:tryptophan synthase
VEALLGLEAGGADIIELGVPFSDPIADGPTIQESSFVALKNGIDIKKCLNYVADARSKGLKVPVVFMGYYNPFLNYGENKLMMDCKAAGVDGFIIVDLPPEEAVKFRDLTAEFGLSYIPLITPTTTAARIKKLVAIASSFIYVVSVSGVTGARSSVSTDLPDLVKRIKEFTNVPLAVGFGVATREHFVNVSAHAEGVVIGSKIITVLKNAAAGSRGRAVKEYAMSVTGRTKPVDEYVENAAALIGESATLPLTATAADFSKMNIGAPSHLMESRFGEFGGQYAPEALVDCLDEIEKVPLRLSWRFVLILLFFYYFTCK